MIHLDDKNTGFLLWTHHGRKIDVCVKRRYCPYGADRLVCARQSANIAPVFFNRIFTRRSAASTTDLCFRSSTFMRWNDLKLQIFLNAPASKTQAILIKRRKCKHKLTRWIVYCLGGDRMHISDSGILGAKRQLQQHYISELQNWRKIDNATIVSR